jgi:hypothetical protein
MAAKRSTRQHQELVLTAEIAQQWSDRNEESRFGIEFPLDAYTDIEYAAARILGQCGGMRELNLSGLTEITPTVARALAKYSGNLNLSGLKKLDGEVAQILARRGDEITLLDGLEELTDRKLAKMLVRWGEETGDVRLRRLRTLSPEAA